MQKMHIANLVASSEPKDKVVDLILNLVSKGD